MLHVDETRLMEGMVPDVYQSREGNILFEISEVKRTVALSPQSSSWPDSLQHVVQGAICVHRLRLLDISRREEVFFLELIEGGSRHVRAHNGQCFFLSEHGYWAVYNGVIPQGVLARCTKFLLFLEGLYRLLPANTLRVPDAIINAVAALLRCRNGSADLLLQDCESTADPLVRNGVEPMQSPRRMYQKRKKTSHGPKSWRVLSANSTSNCVLAAGFRAFELVVDMLP